MTTKQDDHAKAVLARMVAESREGLWQGSLTEVVTDVAHPSYYTKITKRLKAVGAIEQIKRGGGGAPSVWQILNANPDFTVSYLPASEKPKASDFEARLDKLEQEVYGFNTKQAIADLALEIQSMRKLIVGDGG